MSRTQITLTPETQRQAGQCASDLCGAQRVADPAGVFDLGSSGGSDVAKDKRSMIAEVFASAREKSRRRGAGVYSGISS